MTKSEFKKIVKANICGDGYNADARVERIINAHIECMNEEKSNKQKDKYRRHDLMTNEEWIKSMSTEELTRFLCSYTSCGVCRARDDCSLGDNGLYKWLKKEVKGDEE